MPTSTWNIEWLNHNSQRSYPLADGASQLDVTGSFRIPDSFLLSLYFPVHAGQDVKPENFFIRSVAVSSAGYNISIAYNDGSDRPPPIAAAVVARSTHVENNTYTLSGISNELIDFADSVGHITIGRLDEIDKQPAGLFDFDYEGGRLDADCIRPMLRGISSIRVVNGTETSAHLVGDIVLVAGVNVSLVPVLQAGHDPVVIINAIQGEGLTDDCICDTDDVTAPPIRRINGIAPDAGGNLNIVGNDCLKITPLNHGLRFEDTCSQPCCGCLELEAITRDLENFGAQATTLTNFINRLEAVNTEFSNVVLGSRLADGGCAAR